MINLYNQKKLGKNGLQYIFFAVKKAYKYYSYGTVVRDFESEAGTGCSFQFRWAGRH